jgi:SAM-dependent methyltransferase
MYFKDYVIRTGKNVLIRFPKKVARSVEYLRELARFRAVNDGRFSIDTKDLYPCLTDKIKYTPFDQHYTHHPAWAARKVAEIRPEKHVDISSILSFSTIISAFVPTEFYDYRPAEFHQPGFSTGFADLTKLPFDDNAIASLSCMHTVEHIGLARYGDPLDPQGDLKAIAELKRVLAPGGSLLFVTPVGRPRIEFNGHRIYSYEQIAEYFAPLTLKEFSLIPDEGGILTHADPALVARQSYGCGCFWFIK